MHTVLTIHRFAIQDFDHALTFNFIKTQRLDYVVILDLPFTVLQNYLELSEGSW